MSKLRALSGATWIRPEYSVGRGTRWTWPVARAVLGAAPTPIPHPLSVYALHEIMDLPAASGREVARLYAHRGEAR